MLTVVLLIPRPCDVATRPLTLTDAAVGTLTVKSPFVVIDGTCPSFKANEFHVNAVFVPAAPTTWKLRFRSVPAPVNSVVLKAITVIYPGVPVLGVMVHPLLSVPAVLVGVAVGINTV